MRWILPVALAWLMTGVGSPLPAPLAEGWLGRAAWAAEEAPTVNGFRSARFGMSEAEVRKAIVKDFGIEEDAINRALHPLEKTPRLVVTVDELIPDSGRAVITYIFGYSSKKLMQVIVFWSEAANPDLTPENLVATANILRRYFTGQDYPEDRMVTNRPLPDGSVLVFRGVDQEDHIVVLQLNVPQMKIQQTPGGELMLAGEREDAADSEQGDDGTDWLRLSYIEDAANPDVFQLESGDF